MADAIPPATTPPIVVPPEVIQALEDKITAKFQERLDGQSKLIGTLEGKIKKTEKSTETVTTDPLSDRVKALESSQKKVDAREATLNEREVLSAIEQELREQEVEPAQAKRLAKLVYTENKDKVVYDENLTPLIKDQDKNVSVPDWMKSYLQTNDGKAILPVKRNPTAGSLAGRSTTGHVQAGARQVTKEDLRRGNVTLEDLRAGKVVVVDSKF